MYTAIKIAAYIIKKSVDNMKYIDNLKLQKLLYYIQGAYICNKKSKIFSEDILAYRYGPVVKEVYEKYRHNVGSNIYYIETDGIIDDIVEQDREIIDFIINKFENNSSWSLVEKTHEEYPYKTTPIGDIIG